jgi:hypothetical protein
MKEKKEEEKHFQQPNEAQTTNNQQTNDQIQSIAHTLTASSYCTYTQQKQNG